MEFVTPKFWFKEPNFFQKFFLSPVEAIYECAVDHNYKKEYATKLARQKVIAIGGITAGGSGKTVATKAVAEFLSAAGVRVAILSRGFGRKSSETLRVHLHKHNFEDVGDEPIMLAKYFPVIVGKDRAKSAQLAGEDFDVFILDDGLTQRYLQPDLKLIVIDAAQGFGNGHLLPLGPNRLNFNKIKSDIDAVIILGSMDFPVDFAPIFREEVHYEFPEIAQPVVAFCGIGFPDKFFKTLDCYGHYDIVEKIIYPDHHTYKEGDLQELIFCAKKHGARLVTTEKDFVKIPAAFCEEVEIVRGNAKISEDLAKFFRDFLHC